MLDHLGYVLVQRELEQFRADMGESPQAAADLSAESSPARTLAFRAATAGTLRRLADLIEPDGRRVGYERSSA